MQIIGRDNISQTGSKGKIQVDNRQNADAGLMKKIIVGILIGVIVAGIAYWFGWK